MALSNWDIMVLNEKSKPVDSYTSTKGIKVQPYKCWLYLEDKKTWNENSQYVKPTVMSINSGDIKYGGLNIITERSIMPNAIYFAAFESKLSKDYKKYINNGIIGIATCGYNGDKYVGVRESQIEKLKKLLIKWRKNYDIPDEFVEIDLNNARRFNMGDALFADNIATKIGKQKPTIFSELIKNV